MELKDLSRYQLSGVVHENTDGDWVRFTDVEALVKDIEARSLTVDPGFVMGGTENEPAPTETAASDIVHEPAPDLRAAVPNPQPPPMGVDGGKAPPAA